MNGAALIQSILTYICTGGVVGAIGYFAHISKRITILEEKDKMQDAELGNLAKNDTETAKQLQKLNDGMTVISTKLDLLLQGKLKTE